MDLGFKTLVENLELRLRSEIRILYKESTLLDPIVLTSSEELDNALS